jgi:hypothetical protein
MNENCTVVRTPEEIEARRQKARTRRAVVHHEIRLATDALAAADLLLGMNFSIGAVGREKAR